MVENPNTQNRLDFDPLPLSPVVQSKYIIGSKNLPRYEKISMQMNFIRQKVPSGKLQDFKSLRKASPSLPITKQLKGAKNCKSYIQART